eukprot:Hpha_TRINITY_DN10819_c0_g2::TRINITY_DN10819_c0_g2_i1::g.23471::m.23471
MKVLSAVLALSLLEFAAAWGVPLPRLSSIDPGSVSISGLSSGADFANQFAVAFSRTISGVGVFAGQPFHCAVTRFPGDTLVPANPDVPFCDGCPAGMTVQGDHCKANSSIVNTSMLVAAARRMAAAGLIDDVANLASTKVYTYCGTADTGHMGATQASRDFFAELVPPQNLLANFTLPSGHCWPQATGVTPCRVVLKDFWAVENCAYDGPGAMLQHFYGPLMPPADTIDDASLIVFDQQPFNAPAGKDQTGLSSFGWLYVPRSCADSGDGGRPQCRLHVSMHGCSELALMEDVLVKGSKALGLSFNRWAETNRIVVLWPHSGRHGGKNGTSAERHGCWDGYGQTSRGYDTKQGIQMRAIASMIETLAGVNMTV